VNPALRVGGFVAGLAAAFGLAFAIGSSASPLRSEQKQQAGAGDSMGMGEEEHASAEGQLPGLAVSDEGYTLSATTSQLPAGTKVPYRFRITDDAGRPVTSYELEHEKELHLIVVRRDLTGFQHVHPVRAADGTWSVPLDLARAGSYRVFADFHPAGLDRKLTLGTDLFVGGRFAPAALPAPATTSSTDGYVVRISGTAHAGKESELAFDVTRGGKQVTDLEPYLGAFGHLVSLRTGDLAYLHTHPGQEAHAGQRGGPRVRFMTTFPTAGTYRLYLDFKHGGAVHTAAFTVVVER
jgi:hypothetical protein